MNYFEDIYLQKLGTAELKRLEFQLTNWGLQQPEFYLRIDKWFQNFKSENDKQLAYKIIMTLDYLNPQIIEDKITKLFVPVKKYLAEKGKTEMDLIVVIPNEKGDSSSRYSYDLVKLWGLVQSQIYEIRNFRQQYLKEKVAIFFNDTHGSGNQFIRTIFPLIKDVECKKFILCLTITNEALTKFKSLDKEITVLPDIPCKTIFDCFTEID